MVELITIEDFENLVLQLLKDNLADNPSQREAIGYDGDNILMLVAGPGSGKTRVLVLRALRHVLVDGVLPENILITTFTRKSARELRTRWLNWGTVLLDRLRARGDVSTQFLDRIDINRCRIDTLDSIAEQALGENKLPGEVAPILLENAAAQLVFKRQAFGQVYRDNRNALDTILARYTFGGDPPFNQGEALRITKGLCDRLIQDRVQLQQFAIARPENQLIVDIGTNYQAYLRQTNLYDFAFLELTFLDRIRRGTLRAWYEAIQVLLIDEYQDTNPLQEEIYFEIIANARPRVAIVGDDDQSMYRFRGGSVELFTQFASRCQNRTSRQTRRIDMVTNYRSSKEIVQFYNSHITRDMGFASARIVPAKPEVVSSKGPREMPILGMFRSDPQNLADGLAEWLNGLIGNRQCTIKNDGTESYRITLSSDADLGDFVLLSRTVQEINYSPYNGGNRDIRFPGYLRSALEGRGLQVFNPRGRALRTIMDVQILLGLLLACLDPSEQYSNGAMPTNEAGFFIREWRDSATRFIGQDPNPSSNGGLQAFVSAWQNVSRGGNDPRFPRDWPVLELIFKLISWLPGFQNDPEHQVWLEAITSIVANVGMASPYGMQILQYGEHRERSRQSVIRDALLPIAEDEVEVDEEIMPSVPRNRLQFMTIHQAKGLEFPLVIVDVGSHFTRNHPKQRFSRFPDSPSNVVNMEDDIEPFLPAPLRGARPALDRTFDDLMRLYYVAFSRPQSVLLLIGCENCLRYGPSGAIPNIAFGWNRDGTWPWRQPQTSRKPPPNVIPPMVLI